MICSWYGVACNLNSNNLKTFYAVASSKNVCKQECIPVGCVPSALYRTPYRGCLCPGGSLSGGSLSRGLQARIQDLVMGGPQLLMPKVANVLKWSCASGVSNLQPGICILLHSRDSFSLIFDLYFNTKS